MRNHEGFQDPTASVAVARVARENKRKKQRRADFRPVSAGAVPGETASAFRKLSHQVIRSDPAGLVSGATALTSGNSITDRGDVYREERRVPLVYVCSRLAGRDQEVVKEHILQARRFSRFVLSQRAVPMTPHLLYPQFLRDGDPGERELGLRCGLELLKKCDELWAFPVNGISRGMRRELDEALRCGIRIRFFSDELKEVREYECHLYGSPLQPADEPPL